MLLSSQAFSGFLQELSQSGGSAPQVQQPTQQRPTTTPVERTHSQTQRKDVNPHEAARKMSTSQQQPMIGMALMPEVNFDSSLFDTSSWTPAVQHNDFQVFAVTALPEPPVIDFNECSEKSVRCDFDSKTSKTSPTLSPLPDAVRKAGPALGTNPHMAASSIGKTSATLTSTIQDSASTGINPFSSRTLDGMISELEETSRRIGSLLAS
jgi:hypothetical protein